MTKFKLIFIRPYIYIYTNQSETEEQGIINVSNVRIDYNRALEQMIKVKYHKLFSYMLLYTKILLA